MTDCIIVVLLAPQLIDEPTEGDGDCMKVFYCDDELLVMVVDYYCE